MIKNRPTWMTALTTLTLVLLFSLSGCLSEPSYLERYPELLTVPDTCYQGAQDSGSIYLICMSDEYQTSWNGQLLLYAHGYVAPDQPIGIPYDQMILPGPFGPVALSDLVTSMGYGFATTSYPTKGLAVLPAIVDLIDLVSIFSGLEAPPTDVILTGVSEGGLITVLAIEQHPGMFDHGMALSGPYGSFIEQVNHLGDFRVVFDYFFPGLMPGDPVNIPPSLMQEWADHLDSTILPVISDPANAEAVTQLLTVTDASPYLFDHPTSTETIERLLWYNVFATKDAKLKLGGQPFDNMTRVYQGSLNDAALNAGVARTAADAQAIQEIETYYQTVGELRRPLSTLHETGDFLVPYWHATLYQAKVDQVGSGRYYAHHPSNAHGHCPFDTIDVLMAFQALEQMPSHYAFLSLITRAP